jgi:uncharacterized LabA/DUF88 family protein
MLFVDGSNVLMTLFQILGVDRSFRADKISDSALNLATAALTSATSVALEYPDRYQLVRRHWFGSVQGDDEYILDRRAALRRAAFDSELFRMRGKLEKGVDLAVARSMLMHGFNRNYDAAVLAAGDEDYVGLVEDLKRLGVVVIGTFFTAGLSPHLKVAFDRFVELPPLDEGGLAPLAEILRDEAAKEVGR